MDEDFTMNLLAFLDDPVTWIESKMTDFRNLSSNYPKVYYKDIVDCRTLHRLRSKSVSPQAKTLSAIVKKVHEREVWMRKLQEARREQ